ncbi:MAG: helix-turn-helix domain-containing protein [Bacteroides sp.]|nr:helix-turn-helix domain-containing protein [Bacteroides sp.]
MKDYKNSYSFGDNSVLTNNTPRIKGFFESLDRVMDKFEAMSKEYKPALNGERFLTDKEVAARLKVTRRTLLEWRNNGKIAYVQIGGKILYRQSDIQNLLEKHLHRAKQ